MEYEQHDYNDNINTMHTRLRSLVLAILEQGMASLTTVRISLLCLMEGK